VDDEWHDPDEWVSDSSRALMRVMREILNAGGCANPIHLQSMAVDRSTGELTLGNIRIACKDRRRVVCPACSARYKADAWFLATSGLLGGKGLSSEVAHHPRLFATLTAPSFGSVHTITDDGHCRPRRTPPCEHGEDTSCTRRHEDDDEMLGTPLCARCFDYDGAVVWNAMASKLWHRTVDRLRRRLAASQDLSAAEFRSVAQINQLRVAETQRRGLVHLHAIVRGDGPEGPETEPPEWLTTQVLMTEFRRAVGSVSMAVPDGSTVRWGAQLDVTEIPSDDEAGRAAGYIAKYATKTTDGTLALSSPFRTRQGIEHARISPHLRRLVLAAWDLDDRPKMGGLRLREHAHALGFAGHLITKSQRYSTTFGALRAARAAFLVDGFDAEVVDDRVLMFGYLGRGYSDHRGEELAEGFTDWVEGIRKEQRLKRLAKVLSDEEGGDTEGP